MKLGRNDICHCGSGKKYKRCCRQLDIQNQRALQSISRPRDWFLHYSRALTESASGQLDEHAAIQTAKAHWTDNTGDLFTQHALYDLAVTDSGPLISKVDLSDGQVDAEDLQHLQTALTNSHMSLLWIEESKRGKGVRVSDRLLGSTCFVPSAELAESLEPMEVILGRICQWKDENILLPGWEKVRFHGRKKAIDGVSEAMQEDGFDEDAAEERVIWLRREAARVATAGREASAMSESPKGGDVRAVAPKEPSDLGAWRDALHRTRSGASLLDMLLSPHDAATLVPQFSTDDLFHLIRRIGLLLIQMVSSP